MIIVNEMISGLYIYLYVTVYLVWLVAQKLFNSSEEAKWNM